MAQQTNLTGASQIWTVGHSTRSLVEFSDLLLRRRIDLLVDVRQFPGSRRVPHFNKENLAISIPNIGIDYTHLLDLGGRRKVKKDSLNTAWNHPAFRGYADYMETNPFAEGVTRLLDLAKNCRVCYFCSEAVWWRCHRSMISDHLLSLDWLVTHIMAKTTDSLHTYTKPAKIVDGKLSYRGNQMFTQPELFGASS